MALIEMGGSTQNKVDDIYIYYEGSEHPKMILLVEL